MSSKHWVKHVFRMPLAALAAMACATMSPPAATAAPVAGLAPYQRPADAPAIKEFARSDAWRANALRGVTAPAPESIQKFLDHQGAWYTPFNHAGMPGYYDLRQLHGGMAPPAKR
jgi:hypothetical protein